MISAPSIAYLKWNKQIKRIRNDNEMKERKKENFFVDLFVVYRYINMYIFFEYMNIVSILAVINRRGRKKHSALFEVGISKHELQNPWVRCHSYLMLTSSKIWSLKFRKRYYYLKIIKIYQYQISFVSSIIERIVFDGLYFLRFFTFSDHNKLQSCNKRLYFSRSIFQYIKT